MLYLPRDGRPTLAAALSKRVHEWIAQTSWIEGIVAAPRLGREIAKLCPPGGRVGILEYDLLPTRIVADLAEGGVTNVADATALFDRLRLGADGTEIALATRAAQIARDALATLPERPGDISVAVAAVENAARWHGAEEVYVAVATKTREYPSYFSRLPVTLGDDGGRDVRGSAHCRLQRPLGTHVAHDDHKRPRGRCGASNT